MSDMNLILVLVLSGGIAILILLVGDKVIDKYDCERILKHVEASGGKVISIERRLSTLGGRYMRIYDVTYDTSHGKRVEASCITSARRGVAWVSDRPPGTGVEL